eukprot:s1885_g3.t1
MFDVGRESSIELSSSVLALPFPARFYAFQSRCMSRVHLSKPWLLQMSTLALNFKAPSMPWPAWTCECHGQCPGRRSRVSMLRGAGVHGRYLC